MANHNPILPPSNIGKTYRKTEKPNPKAMLFASLFLTPSSKTFMNVRQSGIQAGYSEEYANNITVQRPKWWVELITSAEYRRAAMLDAAEASLQQAVTSDSDDRDDKKIKHDAAKFITERLGKDHYSTRQEITGKDGRRLFTNEQRASATVPLADLFKGVEQPK